ncbi:DUF6513 domain-containing protein [Calycomorphotria hydatis]|uniref:Pterin binding enzyme n=1 Tax=Calycomorphotria hydatis TaxID=2528027 RepID=A0A517TCX1_9PLAN|nr:DUF6513 domain-containing protein [Calycomorphotria hydatis]QDT66216.1 Pterin binding enzyme [Calycomorphotria hydatis]
MPRERILFITGRLAEDSVREMVRHAGGGTQFDFDVTVIGVNVAAFITPKLLLRKLEVEGEYDRAIVPGWCDGDLAEVSQRFGIPFERGPHDVRDLPEYLSGKRREKPELIEYSIEVLAEINHATRLPTEQLLSIARHYAEDGANVIDIGTVPGESQPACVSEIVKLLRDEGLRVSIDSFERAEVEAAIAAGAELVLSCNQSNIDWLPKLGVEVVAIPDEISDLASVEQTLEELDRLGTRFRLDPILEPIGFGFADSLMRYYTARHRWPEVPIMMGIGNLTELTEVDSAGVNMLLIAFCEELGIQSVLTTEVINWCRSSVNEIDIARKLTHYSVGRRVIPKHLDSSLVALRDPKPGHPSASELDSLAEKIRDPNFRIHTDGEQLHLMNRDGHLSGDDPFELFDRVIERVGQLESSHAFYLGYEMAKAVTAMTLGKRYQQDQPLQWGFLTREEQSAVDRRHQKRTERDSEGGES